MSNFKKHVGRIKNTDRRCIVVMMQIPGREDHSLVIDTDALPDRFHDALMQIVDSNEGQQVLHLHTLLSRRIVPDLGVDMMNALHGGGHLRAVPVDNIVMYPQPHSPCPLRTIIEVMGNTVPQTPDDPALQNRHIENQKVEQVTERLGIAKSLLQQADDLQQTADAKRAEAYRIAPSLRPSETVAVEAPAAPAEAVEVVEPVAVPTDEAIVFEVPEIDTSDLPEDVAAAFQAAVAEATTTPTLLTEDADEEEEPAHAVDTSEDSVQAFLDRAAFREDRANKVATEAAQPKRPVGRPRKDGTPAGSAKGE